MLLECVMNVNKLAVKVNDTKIFFSLKVYSHICISLVFTGIAHIFLLEGWDDISRQKSTIYVALQAYSMSCFKCTCIGHLEHLNSIRPVLIWCFPKHFTSISSILKIPLGSILGYGHRHRKGNRERRWRQLEGDSTSKEGKVKGSE